MTIVIPNKCYWYEYREDFDNKFNIREDITNNNSNKILTAIIDGPWKQQYTERKLTKNHELFARIFFFYIIK